MVEREGHLGSSVALDFLCRGTVDHVLRRGPHDTGEFGRVSLGRASHRAVPDDVPFHRDVGPAGRPRFGRRHGVDEAQAAGGRYGAQHDLGGPVHRRLALFGLGSGTLFPFGAMDLFDLGDRSGRLRCRDVYRFPVGGGAAGRFDTGPVGADGLVDQPHPDGHGSGGFGDRRTAWGTAFRRNVSFFGFDWTRHACFDTILGEASEDCCGKRCSC